MIRPYNPGDGDQQELTDWYAASRGRFMSDTDAWEWTETDGRLAFSDIGLSDAGPRAQLVAYVDDRQHRPHAISLEIDDADARRIARALLDWAGAGEEVNS